MSKAETNITVFNLDALVERGVWIEIKTPQIINLNDEVSKDDYLAKTFVLLK